MTLLIYSIFLDASNNSATRFACETPQHQAPIFMDFWWLTTDLPLGSRWEIVFMSFSPRLSDPWQVRNGGGLLCVRFIVFYHVYLFRWYVYIYIYINHIGWFSTLLVFQCKCSDVRCFIFDFSLAQALLKLCAKLFNWLSYLIFDHAWARARPGWSVPGQK